MSQQEIEKRHQEICEYIHKDLWIPKNNAYGDSFHRMYAELGIISAVTQISHKYNRLIKQAKELNAGHICANDEVFNENIKDTLLDLANYCILTYLELERSQQEEQSNGSY